MSTDGTGVPAPLAEPQLASIPGVLGTIARERAQDYAGRDLPSGQPDPNANRTFYEALSQPGLAFICEVKRSSPSQGEIRQLDPVDTATAYRRGGAAAVSVLTEPRHFGGSLSDLEAVTRTVGLPAMRKEFVVHPAQLAEAVEAGAQAALLMVSVLGERTAEYVAYARTLGIETLVEVHNEPELEVALAAAAPIIGVNNRDLTSLDVDRSTAPALIKLARERGYDGLLVAESGYAQPSDLTSILGLADAILVGTALARAGNPEEALARLKAASAEAEA